MATPYITLFHTWMLATLLMAEIIKGVKRKTVLFRQIRHDVQHSKMPETGKIVIKKRVYRREDDAIKSKPHFDEN